MEKWQLDFEWLRVQHWVKETMGHESLPGLQGILMLIGMQELGLVQHKFSKEEKQDLMHIAVCTVLSTDGYYDFKGLDQDGWPHFDLVRPVPKLSTDQQEVFLKEKVIAYFQEQGMEAFSEN
ncbi:MAG: hypothetical protein KTR24_02745 [Saprospiraceae bacterium]|nr:hypothetical protein [Saprospiraceae bacterium]